MPIYNPPLRDMQFVLNEVLDLPTELRELPRMPNSTATPLLPF